jgi:release factor glutamine methyltransferase
MHSRKQVLNAGRCRLEAAGIDSAKLDSELLLAHALSVTREQLLFLEDNGLSEEVLGVYDELLSQRERRKPLAYIAGRKEFFGLDFQVSPAVLIPRPDTECVVEKALLLLEGRPAQRILDVCTGSGCIAIALASHRQLDTLLATDISDAALEVARANVAAHNHEHRIELLKGDLFEPAADKGPFDLIISNPPYVQSEEMKGLMPEVRDFEPHLALVGEGADGVGLYEKMLECASHLLSSDGLLIFEIGFDQKEAIEKLPSPGLSAPNFFKDLAGNWRGAFYRKVNY